MSEKRSFGVYRQEGAPEKPSRLSEEDYNKALSRFVKYCHDVIIVGHDGNFYLPERRADKTPPGVWFIGGQIGAFTDIGDSLVKTLERETKTTFDKTRFKHVAQNRYYFNGKDGGATPHDAVCEVFTLKLKKDEIEGIKLDTSEYVDASLKCYNKRALEAIEDPFTRQIFLDLWKKTHDPAAFLASLFPTPSKASLSPTVQFA